MGRDIGSLPFIHLGVAMGQNMSRINSWSLIMNRFQSRLADWKTKCLSFGGRLTLIKLVLDSLGNYLMCKFPNPIIVLNSLEAMRTRFFWVGICMIVICIGLGGTKSLLLEMLEGWEWEACSPLIWVCFSIGVRSFPIFYVGSTCECPLWHN